MPPVPHSTNWHLNTTYGHFQGWRLHHYPDDPLREEMAFLFVCFKSSLSLPLDFKDSTGKQKKDPAVCGTKKRISWSLSAMVVPSFGLTEGVLEVEKDNCQQEMAHPCVLSLVHPWSCRLLIIWRHIGSEVSSLFLHSSAESLSLEATVKIYNQAGQVSHFHKSWDTSGKWS